VGVAGESTLRQEPGGVVISDGKVATQEVFTVTARTAPKGITAIRLEALPDESLPNRGPGTATDGDFFLSEFKLSTSGAGGKSGPVKSRGAAADFSAEGRDAERAIDGDNATGWGIAPAQAEPHVAVFEVESPLGGEGETLLTFSLEFKGWRPQYDLGKF